MEDGKEMKVEKYGSKMKAARSKERCGGHDQTKMENTNLSF